MSILDFLTPPEYKDPVLGTLVRKSRYWRGVISLGSDSAVPLLLAGNRTAPDQSGLGLARDLGHRYTALLPAIEGALFDHYEPYSETAESEGGEELGRVPRLSRPEQVWRHVSVVRVLIEPLGGVNTVEIAYRTEWDVEHTVGARFQSWTLTELNGSVI